MHNVCIPSHICQCCCLCESPIMQGAVLYLICFCVWGDPDKAYLLRLVNEGINKWGLRSWIKISYIIFCHGFLAVTVHKEEIVLMLIYFMTASYHWLLFLSQYLQHQDFWWAFVLLDRKMI